MSQRVDCFSIAEKGRDVKHRTPDGFEAVSSLSCSDGAF